MAEAAVTVNHFFCHSCSRHFGSDASDLVCPHCDSGFVEVVQNTSLDTSTHADIDIEQPANGTITALDMLRGSLMHYWPSDDSSLGTGYEDADDSVSFFQFNIQPADSSPGASSSTTQNGQASTSETSRVFGGARPRNMPERYNLRQRIHRRPSPTNRGSTGQARAQDGQSPTNFLVEGFLQQILSGTEPSAMFGTNATVQGAGNPGANPWGMFALHGDPRDYVWGANGLDNIITQLLGQLDSSGPPPASADAIQKLPTITISEEQVGSNKECSVCMETFAVNDKAKKLPCAHLFHIHCIEPWLKLHNTCPICRKKVEHCHPGTSSDGVYFEDAQD